PVAVFEFGYRFFSGLLSSMPPVLSVENTKPPFSHTNQFVEKRISTFLCSVRPFHPTKSARASSKLTTRAPAAIKTQGSLLLLLDAPCGSFAGGRVGACCPEARSIAGSCVL